MWIREFFKGFSKKFLQGWAWPKDFGDDSDHNPDPGVFLKDYLFTVVILTDSKE